ncbi:hypothetical protein NE848_14760 [Gramella jeungdoensis]|uniref:Uncharacterized protein n=1 Tax=Gramella jeungdoensis TaxID=708091 RepID=A0ABT0Z541_9FLAO|nr:hypothetical protein [Gramella jeungdoensis]MCM8570654.1 hypothetical protein [Gramella jeungdoensis]
MKYSRIFILVCLPILILNLYAVAFEIGWLINTTEFLVYIPLFIGFYKRLDFSNLNIFAFLGLSLVASIFSFFREERSIYFIAMFFSMASYFFLVREALKYTQREAANKFMLFFFFILVAVNIYFLFQHLQQMEMHLAGVMEFGFYSAYYINLLVLAVVALIYYLNSYSRKSVFFISLVMALVVSDVLRDMAAFYLRDTSVLFIECILRFSAVILAFQFYATREKKLRLINLV